MASKNTNTNGGGSVKHGQHISALDANNNRPSTHGSSAHSHSSGPSSQPTTIMASNVSNAEEAGSSNRYTYADDDSVVSSNVTEDPSHHEPAQHFLASGVVRDHPSEVAILSRAVETDLENANNSSQPEKRKMGLMPRNRSEWCIVILCILLVLGVAVGVGLGFYFMNKSMDNNNTTNTETTSRGGPLDGGGQPGSDNNSGGNGDIGIQSKDDNDNVGGNSTDEDSPRYPTFAPTDSNAPSPYDPQDGSQAPPQMEMPLPGDMAGAVEYHLISQEISDIASFSDMAGGGGGDNSMSPQQRAVQQAQDFLVLRDSLPLTIMDEDDEQSNNGGDDDPLAIPDEPKRRPYLQTSTPAYRVVQRFVTAVLFHATNGENWGSNTFWLEPGVHECEWVGVSCEELPIPAISLEEALENPQEIPRHDDGSVATTIERMVVAIDLAENNMVGFLPVEILALPYLQRLGLWSNQIGGSLPSQIGKLTRLNSLHLDDNLLTGNIPSQIGQLSEMTVLQLGWNKGISGRIPAEIGNLSKLEQLRLSNMDLRGPIPTSFGNLRNLKDLYLQSNRLGRALPEELKNLINLESLVLSDNEFTGGIPVSWARNLIKLKRLEIQSNRMEFDVDEKMCSLRTNSVEGGNGLLEALVADCDGDVPKVSCTCCECLP